MIKFRKKSESERDEACGLCGLNDALHSGDIWVETGFTHLYKR